MEHGQWASNFWPDSWAINSLLLSVAISSVNEASISAKVRDLWDEDLGWKWTELRGLLPNFVLLGIASITLLKVREGVDVIAWKNEASGRFSSKAAFKMITEVNCDGVSKGNPDTAACGGYIRNELGEWRYGFMANLGVCDALAAELWAV
ncbi:hypothetical protein V2J09_016730 [Rumex salicifolius]